MRVTLCLVVVLSACGNKTKDAPPPPPAAGSGSAQVAAPTAAAPAAAASTSKLEAARCDDPCLFLLDTPIAQLVDTFKAKCAGKETKDLGFQDCKQLDYVRNCVYAAHGLVYKKKKWKKVFEAKPWYEPHADVDAKKIAMSDVEHANVHELYERGKACKKGLSISGADYERIRKWFAALPKAPVPKLAAHWEDDGGADAPPNALTADKPAEFFAWLNENSEAKAKMKSGKVYASYILPEVLSGDKTLLDFLKVKDASKLRAIALSIEGEHGTEEAPFTEGLDLTFVYDDKDQLIGIVGKHYAFD
jgi:hypothetical protein